MTSATGLPHILTIGGNDSYMKVDEQTIPLPKGRYCMSPPDDYLKILKRENGDIYLIFGWQSPGDFVGVKMWILAFSNYKKNIIYCLKP